MAVTARVSVRDWSDAVHVGPVRLFIRAAGRLTGWEITGPTEQLTAAQRIELAAVLKKLAGVRGTVWEIYADLFPERSGGLARAGIRQGVSGVYHD